jgi:hypothetical protein
MEDRPEDFVADGALRDGRVLDTTIDDWRRMFDGLRSVPGHHVLTWTLSELARSPEVLRPPSKRDGVGT